MGQEVKGLVVQAWYPEFFPGNHIKVEEKAKFTVLSSDFHTCVVACVLHKINEIKVLEDAR